MSQPELDASREHSASTRGNDSERTVALLRLVVVGLMLHLAFAAMDRAYGSGGHPFALSFSMGGKPWSLALADRLIVRFRSPVMNLRFPLMWALLLQMEIAAVAWWWVWIRGSNPNFRRVARRLLQVSLLAFVLFLFAPAGSAVGAAAFGYWILILPQGDWRGWWDLCRILWIGPTLMALLIFYGCVALRLRMRRKVGTALAAALSFNSVALLAITWMRHHDWPWTHAVVLFGLANLTAALDLWTGIIELRVMDRRWTEAHASGTE